MTEDRAPLMLEVGARHASPLPSRTLSSARNRLFQE
jgi:hypothetical protein